MALSKILNIKSAQKLSRKEQGKIIGGTECRNISSTVNIQKPGYTSTFRDHCDDRGIPPDGAEK